MAATVSEAPQEATSGGKPLTENAQLHSTDSQTASDFIKTQLALEAEAREALPYTFDHCTQPLGAIRQNVFSCITCNPPPISPDGDYQAAGICYACSIACHGEHTLVELFGRRDFICDCGTTRIANGSACTLRINPDTGLKEPLRSRPVASSNVYNKNYKNRFCACNEWYDAHEQKGTMYQCLGIATEDQGGCGEDWWHPECLMGLPRDAQKKVEKDASARQQEAENGDAATGEELEQLPPEGFPPEDTFEHLVCYKCVNAVPILQRYAQAEGFIALPSRKREDRLARVEPIFATDVKSMAPTGLIEQEISRKRKADEPSDTDSVLSKRTRVEIPPATISTDKVPSCRAPPLPPASTLPFSLFLTETFRDRLCRCPGCYPHLAQYPPLLHEEETYEPPLSEDGSAADGAAGGNSIGTGSLLDRGEAALSNVERVRAIEGVMVYNHLRDKVKDFLKPFAESGKAVGAEDIKAYFETLRGDAEAIKQARGGGGRGQNENGDGRKEQDGY